MLKKILTENKNNYTWNPGHILQSWGHICWQVFKALINFIPHMHFTEKIPVYLLTWSQVSYT